MKRFLKLVIISFLTCCSRDYTELFESFQETLKKEDVENQLKYLKKGANLGDYYLLTENKFCMFPSKAARIKNEPEFILHFGSKPKPILDRYIATNYKSKPLSGLRVAIDPGHLGGKMATIEDRFIDMSLPEPDGLNIKFDEGTLALYAAKLLRFYLKLAGADVLLTRERPGQAVCALSFEEWCARNFGIKNELDWLDPMNQQKIVSYLKKASPSFAVCKNENPEQRLRSITDAQNAYDRAFALKKALFRLCYNQLDLKARAIKINAFNPDLTIIIHFNASGGPQDISSKNYNLAFVPGSFQDGELQNALSREEFVRLILTDDIEESVKLSSSVVKSMENILNIEYMNDKTYQFDRAIFACDGVYCRNLALTRLVHGPICYGETLIQNNPEEAKRLAKEDFEFEGKLISSRLDEVAKAYFQGICEYLGVYQPQI